MCFAPSGAPSKGSEVGIVSLHLAIVGQRCGGISVRISYSLST